MGFEEESQGLHRGEREIPESIGEDEVAEETRASLGRRQFLKTSVMAAGAAFLGLSDSAEAKKEGSHDKHGKHEKHKGHKEEKEKKAEGKYEQGIKFLRREAAERATEISAVYYRKGKKEEWIYDLVSGNENGVDLNYPRMQELILREKPDVMEFFHTHPHSKVQIEDIKNKKLVLDGSTAPKNPPTFQDLIMAYGVKELQGLEGTTTGFKVVEESGVWEYAIDRNSTYLQDGHKLEQEMISLYPLLEKGDRFQTFLSKNPDFKRWDPFHQIYSLISIQTTAQNFLNLEEAKRIELIHQNHIKFFRDPHTRAFHDIKQKISRTLHNNENNDKIVEALLLAYREIGAEVTFTPHKKPKNETSQRRKNSRHH